MLKSIIPLRTVAMRREAVRVMADRYGAELLAYLRWLCSCDSTAEDLLSKLYAKLERGRVRRGKRKKAPGGSVFTAAKNLFIDWWRKQQRECNAHEEYAHSKADVLTAGPFCLLAAVERGEVVRKAVAALPATECEAITLVYFEQMTFEEAARAMGRCPSGVHKLCKQGYVKLGSMLSPTLLAA